MMYEVKTPSWTFQAEQALASNEVPVGCVFVHEGQIIGWGMNDTNRSLNVGSIVNARQRLAQQAIVDSL